MISRTMSGQGLVEYALIIMLVALVVIGALGAMSTTLNDIYLDRVPGVFP